MKNVLFAAVLLLVPLCAIGQTDTIPKTAILYGNKIRAAVNSNGLLFHDLETGEGAFTHDDYPDIPLIKSVGFWAGGVDPGGNLKVAAMHPDSAGRRDFIPGYIDPDTGQAKDFNYIASVTRIEIESHRQDFASNQVIDFPITSIFSWPGVGNPHFEEYTGMELPNFTIRNSAPFFDNNEDLIYDPEDGDYPITGVSRGCFDPQLTPDQLMWTTAHDLTNHTLTEGGRLKITVQPTIFVYNCTINSMFASTVCVRYRVINHALEDVDSMFYAVNVDFDLGCPADDYIGVSPDNTFAYAYNSNDVDEDCDSFTGLGENPPIVLCDFARGPLDEDRNELSPLLGGFTLINDTDISPPALGQPLSAIQYYRLLSGSWRDGSPLEAGGDGYQEGTSSVDFPFPDNPNLVDGWSETTVNNPLGNRNFIGTMGNFLFEPEKIDDIIVGFTVLQDVPFETIYEPELQTQLYQYYSGFCNYEDGCGQVPTNTNEKTHEQNFKLYPNPTSNLLNLEFQNQKTPTTLRILDFSGKELWIEKKVENLQQIQVGWLPTGVYFLEGEFPNGNVREKFVVFKE